MIPRPLLRAVQLQLAYGGLVILWQVIGLTLMATGERPLGPTASVEVAIFALVTSGFCLFSARRWPVVFVLASVGITAMAIGPIMNAFTADPSLWPSDEARYVGVAVNAVAPVATLLAVIGFIRLRQTETS